MTNYLLLSFMFGLNVHVKSSCRRKVKMRTYRIRFETALLTVMVVMVFAICGPSRAAVLVVAPDTPDHQANEPYDTWENAATNIQTAVTYAEANALTEVWVSNGWYLLPGVVTVKKGITLRSYAEGRIDKANTVIDGNNTTRGFTLDHTDAILDGFTVTNCYQGAFGAAVYMNKGGIVRNCDFAFNHQLTGKTWYGGTVYMEGGVVENCLFRENRVGGYGGGIAMRSGTMLVTNCTFIGNSASSSGGGVSSIGGIGHIVDCVFSNNFSQRGGGYSASPYYAATALVDRCVFDSNITTNDGSSGSSARGGGAVQLASKATVCLRNCLLMRNRALNIRGGGIFLSYATNSWVENCTIVSNYSQYQGGGIAVTGGDSSVGFRNTIIYDNWSDAAGYADVAANAINLTWTNNCVGTTINLNDYGAGNLLQVDPKFVNPAANDWHLLPTSPCANKGDTLDWMTTAKDLDGGKRVRYDVVDMGCYETAMRFGTVLCVR